MEVNQATNGQGAREEVERLAQEFVERRRRGEQPLIEEYAAAHPALAPAIRELFATLLIVEDLGGQATESGILPPLDAGAPRSEEGLRQVGDYHIVREIGRGGMGVVYEAEQVSLGRRVALKVLPYHSLLDSKRLERFQQEARAAARLSHPNIVPVYGVGEHLGMHFYVMQLIPGQGLNRVIEEVRRAREAGDRDAAPAASLDPGSSSSLAAGLESGGARGARERYFRNVARLGRDTALALDYAHGEGILHRDVKPSNLLLDPAGRVWLTDFGLAKAQDAEDITHSGDFVGTLLYMAPERFKGWSDPRSDVYSLGITLHELLTLRPAFVERDRAQLVRKVADEMPPAPRRLDRSIPRDLETIVLRAIAKEPAQRYASARALAEDLDRFLAGRPVEARRSSALSLLGRWCARNPLLAALMVMVPVLLVIAVMISSTAAVRLAREQSAGREQLRASRLAEASALRSTLRPGRRFAALAALRQAAAIRPGPDLVNEAIACLAQVDLRLLVTWEKGRDDMFSLSPTGATMALTAPGGEVSIRSAADNHELFRLPGPGFHASFTAVNFSPTGDHLAARYELGERAEWLVWDLDRRVSCAAIKDGFNDNCIDFARTGNWFVVGTRDRSLRIVDLATGNTLREVEPDWRARSVAVHPGGRLLAFSSDRTRKVHVYDRESDRVVRSLPGNDNQGFQQVAWHPDGRSLAAACRDHLLYLWNAETGERIRTLNGHWAEVMNVSFAPGGSLVASGGWDPAVRFWESGSGRPLFSLPEREGYFAFTANHRCWSVLATRAEIWELASDLPSFTLLGHDRLASSGQTAKHPRCIALAPGGQLAATAGDDGVRLWDLAARAEVARLPETRVHTVLFDKAGTALYSVGGRGLYRWPVRTMAEGDRRIAIGPAQRLTQLDALERAALAADDSRIAVIHQKSHAHVFAPSQPGQELQLQGLPADWSIALSPDGEWAAAGTWGRDHGQEVWIWRLSDPGAPGPADAGRPLEPVRRLRAPRAEVRFHPGGAHLATCTPQDLALWRLADGEVVWRVEREPGLRFPGQVAFDRGGKLAAFTYTPSRIWLIDALGGRKLADLEAPEPILITSLAIEGGIVAAAVPARRFHVWDLNALGREIAGLGMSWEVPVTGKPLEEQAPLHVVRVDETLDLLLDETTDLAPRQLFRPTQHAAFLPRLASCAQIDQTLARPGLLISEEETWRFFRGRAEPSPGLEWTGIDHDDQRWEEGSVPITGWEAPEEPAATRLVDQLGAYTTLYARRAFDVPDPARVSRLVLAAELEDGFVVHLNGVEVGRVNAGKRGARLPFQALAPRQDRQRLTEVVEIDPSILRQGKNVLAIQALSYGLDSRLHLLPVLAAVPAPQAERDRDRTDHLLARADGSPEPSLLAYRDGRILQRGGRHAEALARFEKAGDLDRGAAEPLLRRLACHRALGEHAHAETLAREAIERGVIPETSRLWRAWHHLALVDLHRSPAEALASWPRDTGQELAGPASDHRAILEELAAGRAIRIHCGGDEVEARDGKRWLRDRFHVGGVVVERGTVHPHAALSSSGGEALETPVGPGHRERAFPGTTRFRPGYSLPLPPGRYRITLHFVEWIHMLPGKRVFDVLLEGRTVIESCNPLRLGSAPFAGRKLEVDVRDGALDLDFIAHQDQPRIAAIEVELLAE